MTDRFSHPDSVPSILHHWTLSSYTFIKRSCHRSRFCSPSKHRVRRTLLKGTSSDKANKSSLGRRWKWRRCSARSPSRVPIRSPPRSGSSRQHAVISRAARSLQLCRTRQLMLRSAARPTHPYLAFSPTQPRWAGRRSGLVRFGALTRRDHRSRLLMARTAWLSIHICGTSKVPSTRTIAHSGRWF